MLVNEYTVGGSLLLIGAGFWSTRFTEALGYKLFTIPSMLPLIGGMDVTVGRAAALVPLSLGAAFLLRTIRPVTNKVPVVSNLADIADNLVAEVSKPVASEIKGAEKAAEEVEVEGCYCTSPQGPWNQRILPNQEGNSSLQACQATLCLKLEPITGF
jgi:hypothetical protein